VWYTVFGGLSGLRNGRWLSDKCSGGEIVARDGRKKRSYTELSEQVMETREALERQYPGLEKGYKVFVCQYRAFLKSYLQFLGVHYETRTDLKPFLSFGRRES
jgi:hypothetical protein